MEKNPWNWFRVHWTSCPVPATGSLQPGDVLRTLSPFRAQCKTRPNAYTSTSDSTGGGKGSIYLSVRKFSHAAPCKLTAAFIATREPACCSSDGPKAAAGQSAHERFSGVHKTRPVTWHTNCMYSCCALSPFLHDSLLLMYCVENYD